MDRKILNYLPQTTQKFVEIKETMNTEQKEIDMLWGKNETVLNNQFINECDERGIKRWEKLYSITSKPGDSLDDRKFRILAKATEQLPYTKQTLTQQLEALCGVENYTCTLKNYCLNVRVALTAKNNFDDVKSLLERMIPLNININLSLLYNQHKKLASYTHQQLNEYTHKQLRNEVLE